MCKEETILHRIAVILCAMLNFDINLKGAKPSGLMLQQLLKK